MTGETGANKVPVSPFLLTIRFLHLAALRSSGQSHSQMKHEGIDDSKDGRDQSTRSNGCEVTMDLDLKVTSATSLSGAAVASETGCGLTQGQTFPGTWTRIL